MKFVDLTIQEFLNKIDDATPTPGGGSVAALVIAEGISLLRMVGHLTINKKKFMELESDIKQLYIKQFNKLTSYKQQALILMELDTDAYNRVIKAFALPKQTNEEKAIRSNKIAEATIQATQIPFQTVALGAKVINEALTLFDYSNQSAISDFGVGLKLIEAGIISARYNVLINMANFKDIKIKDEFINSTNQITNQASTKVKDLLENLDKLFM